MFRNDFGKRIEKILEGKNITANLKAAKEKAAESEDEADEIKASADAEATKVFMEAFKEFEVQKAPAGPTWKALITKGEIEGIKP